MNCLHCKKPMKHGGGMFYHCDCSGWHELNDQNELVPSEAPEIEKEAVEVAVDSVELDAPPIPQGGGLMGWVVPVIAAVGIIFVVRHFQLMRRESEVVNADTE